MRKIFVLIFTALTMMICCAGPLMVHAEDSEQLVFASDSNSDFPRFIDYIDNHSSDKYFLVKFSAPLSNGAINHFMGYIYVEQPYLGYVSLSSSDGVYSISSTRKISFHYSSYEGNWVTGDDFFSFSYDSGNNSITLFDEQHNPLVTKMNNLDTPYSGINIYDVTSNFFDIQQYNALNLSVTFKPTLSGTVSRTQTIEGKQYTSTSLDMYVSNNGSEDAQFSMFIVPKGESITFPDHILQDNKGFIGNPVFVYVSDEWSSFTVGLVGSSVYAPCSWHTVPKGFKNQIYSISWNQMCLQPDTQYDCVVYGCVNSTATQTNTSSQWEMRPVYTVTSSLVDVTEVYRSSFTITDPAEFNPNFIDEAGRSHPWNPNADNSNLFNVASAYRDDNGNVVIKGQTGGGINIFTSDLNSEIMNVNNLFGDTFRFFTALFCQFPPVWVALITIGLSLIVVIAVVKRATS